MSKQYTVDYHCSLAAYFAPESQPSSSTIIDVWASLAILGRESVSGHFVSGDTFPKTENYTLGELDGLPPRSDKRAQVGVSYISPFATNSWFDSDFLFAVSDSTPCGEGSFPAHLLLSVSRHWIERIPSEACLKLLRGIFQSLDRHKPFFGLIDYSLTRETFAGTVFGSIPVQSFPLRQHAEINNWVLNSSSSRRCRGIYWGNYLGEQILEQLGGREVFVSKLRKFLAATRQEEEKHLFELPNGVVLFLHPHFLETVPGKSRAISLEKMVRTMTWYQAELAAHGVLGNWEPDLAAVVQAGCRFA